MSRQAVAKIEPRLSEPPSATPLRALITDILAAEYGDTPGLWAETAARVAGQIVEVVRERRTTGSFKDY
jgi:hypothetical protein